MPTIAWSPELDLHQPEMDTTHRGFIDRLGALEEAVATAPHDTGPVLDELLRHTVEHFAQEERWMTAVGFAAANCHAAEHASVLQVMREAARRHAAEPDLALLRTLVAALDQWFGIHARSMDAGLSDSMTAAGFDPATERAIGLSPRDAGAGCGSLAGRG